MNNAMTDFLFFDGAVLTASLDAYRRGEPRITAAVTSIVRSAGQDLQHGPYSVVFKTGCAPSGDKHDFYCPSKYYWPDPSKPDGLPWIRRDGQTHPSFDGPEADYGSIRALDHALNRLSLAAFFTGRSEFGEYAARLARTWFLDPSTRMNPGCLYSQGIPGINTGRASGIISIYKLTEMIDPFLLLYHGGFLSDSDITGLKHWFGGLTQWFLESDFGREELANPNNHGVWCRVQLAAYALFSGDTTTAARTVRDGLDHCLPGQVAEDGSLPAEIARTLPLHYISYALTAFFRLSQLGLRAGLEDPFREGPSVRIFRKALQWVYPYFNRSMRFDRSDVLAADLGSHREPGSLYVYRIAARHLGLSEYAALYEQVTAGNGGDTLELTGP